MARGLCKGLVSDKRGQASAELVAVVPIVLLAALAMAQLVVAGWALVSAGEAARAGARAVHVGGEAAPAARKALPLLLEPASVTESAGQVEVEVRAPALIPGMSGIPISATTALDPEEGK